MRVHRRLFAISATILFATFGGPVSAIAQNGFIKWNDSPAQAFAKASELDKPVLIYISAAQCGFCRKMERDTWKDEAVIESLHERFVPLKVHGDQNPAWLDRYEINGFPTLLVLSKTGEPLNRIEGYHAPKELLRRLNETPPAIKTKTRH